MTEQLLQLPKKPGTVIAIGDWWLIRLRPYEDTGESAWELLPMPSKDLADHARRNGVKTQCIYGDQWVLAEAEQEGGYVVISDPRERPSGIQYFTPDEKCDAGPEVDPLNPTGWRPVWSEEMIRPPVGARVQLRLSARQRGEVVESRSAEAHVAHVHWDGSSLAAAAVLIADIEPEREQ